MLSGWARPGPSFEADAQGGALCHLLELVDDVSGVLELRCAGEGLFEDDVGDAGGCVLRQVGGLEVADLPPAEPPLLAEILEVVHLAAAFPIDVDGA